MADTNLPLDGIKILDLSRVLAGPWCTQLLGDLGAEVIKIEQPDVGDMTRSWGPPFVDESRSAYFLATNRNKTFIEENLNDADSRQRVLKLMETADIVIENFRPEYLKSIDLNYESLSAKFPAVIWCTISGFNSETSFANEPGFDALIQAMSGLMSITGEPDRPAKVGVAITDILTGLYASSGILAALRDRDRTGLGQKLEVSLFDTQVACLANVISSFLISKETPQPLGTAHPSIVPYQAFATKATTKNTVHMIMIAIGNDKQFAQLCEALGENWNDDECFSKNSSRVENRKELIAMIESKLLLRSLDEWKNVFSKYDFPFGPINNFQDLYDHPYCKEAGIFVEMDNSKIPTVRNPLRFSRTPITIYSTPPKLGEAKQ